MLKKVVDGLAWLLRRRVSEKTWRGCMAHHLHTDRRGVAVFSWMYPVLVGDRYERRLYWLVRWDGGDWGWMPKCSFNRSENWGFRVRDC